MRLTHYTDYAMRVLLYLGGKAGEQLSPIAEIARAYGISQNHLMKVVNDLVNAGYLESVRGRYGGVRLARLPRDINIGEVVRHTEDGFNLVDCASCVIAPACGLTGALNEALAAFMKVLDGYCLEDLLTKRRDLQWIFAAVGDDIGKQAADQAQI
ncbi:RrF2 family transcriptional regulator [Sphingopyxis sp. RIFCSPHIGHO2_12_FULL_65_19]|uniref:RrF2 family transcriptional regulator n=1 Tax=Sphingopyxis sp. RIFCSPHIGHO2_12_FULL_65_19 TaxID=1802172 RepID=UPI0008CD783A|nr:Rrf2 family transcriptional regulator [Sphingopyxis sp. RIFCSPHIGHO2_12_FULL_65_19]OHD07924.1 MAG: Rrf2 family transcriptional regulator [Sphingopyxis sp. RIFCSPHIGHO2_12_FULL_65_19]